MKRILVVLFSLICFIGYAQTPYPTPYTQQGSPSTLVQVRGGWKADSTAMMPKYVDTITANLYKTKLYAGSIIFTTGDGNYWYRSADAARWLLFGNSVTNCLGTQLISGSITWSGSGLIFDATDLDYSIICTRYSSSATTLTLSTADPTYARIDKLYADITGNVGVITGTPAPNPQEPVINPLSQLDMGIVYIPAGSTVPAGTTQTVIYNENVEWTGTSDVPSVNFDYATNPYIGTVSTYLPNAPNSSYVEWQSNGIDYLFSDAQYLKFWVRLNDNFVSDPLSFLDVTFEYTDVTVSQTLAVGNGDYNMDYSLINQWQLVSIPLTGITTYGTEFNSVHFVINSAPTSFQLDYVYLLETATIPPAPVGGTWLLNGNSAINDVTQYIGTRDAKKLNFGTNGQIRAYIDTAGIELLIDDTTANVMLIDSNGKIRKTYQPTILADSPLVIYLDGNQRHIKADTTRRGAAVATQYYADSVAGAGGGGGWGLLGNAGTNVFTNFIGTTDDVGLRFKVNNNNAGYIDNVNYSTSFGLEALNGSPSGDFNNAFGYTALFSLTTGTENNAFGHTSLYSNQTGNSNNAFGYSSLYVNTGSENNAFGYRALAQSVSGTMNTAMGDSALITLTTGSRNTAIGANADVATSSTDSAVAIGYQASASTKQLAFSPYLNTMFLNLDSASGTAPAIAGIDENGNWRKYATPAGGSTTLTNTYVGVGNVSNAVSGSNQFTSDDSTLSYKGRMSVGNSNAMDGNFNMAIGTNNTFDSVASISLSVGTDNTIIGHGANLAVGESQFIDSAEASSIIYGAFNTIGTGANDAVAGGTGTSVFALAGIGLGLAHEVNGEASVAIGGNGNITTGVYSGTFAGTSHETQDTASVVIGGQNNSVSGVNAAIIGGENNFTSGRNTVVLGGSGINGAMANTTYVDSLRVGGKIVAPNLPTSGTYSKSLAIDASGNVYTKDTAALTVSNLGGLGTGVGTLLAATPTGTTSLVGSASPTFTGVLTANVISATGVVATTSTLRSGTSSPIEHAASNRFTASSNGFENLTSSANTANTANLSVGSLRTGYVAKTANYTATAFDETISCSTNAFTITLPTAVGCAGQKYNITNSTAANTITIGTTSSQVFGNVTATPTTLSLIGLGAVIVVSDGANWLQLK